MDETIPAAHEQGHTVELRNSGITLAAIGGPNSFWAFVSVPFPIPMKTVLVSVLLVVSLTANAALWRRVVAATR